MPFPKSKSAIPRPWVFLILFALCGVIVDSIIALMGDAGIGAILLISGVILAALWYPRWVHYLAIGLLDLMLLPTITRLEMPAFGSWLFFLGGTLILIMLAEAIHQLALSYQQSVANERRAQQRLLEILAHNPAVVYGLRSDPAAPGGYVVSFVGGDARNLLGIDLGAYRQASVCTGLAGRVAPLKLRPGTRAWNTAMRSPSNTS